MNAFANGIDRLFRDVNLSSAARYRDRQEVVEIRVLERHSDALADAGTVQAMVDIRPLRVRSSELPAPKINAKIELLDDVGGVRETVEIKGAPRRDGPRGLLWNLDVRPIGRS